MLRSPAHKRADPDYLRASGHIHLVHFRSPAADSSLCHFDDKLPGLARSRFVRGCASVRQAECNCGSAPVRTGGAAPLSLRPRPLAVSVYTRRWHRPRAARFASRQRWGRPDARSTQPNRVWRPYSGSPTAAEGHVAALFRTTPMPDVESPLCRLRTETPSKVCSHRTRSDMSGTGSVSPDRPSVAVYRCLPDVPRKARATGILMRVLFGDLMRASPSETNVRSPMLCCSKIGRKPAAIIQTICAVEVTCPSIRKSFDRTGWT